MTKKLNILVVTKDIAEFMIYVLVVAMLRARGHKVTVVAEGLSLAKWIDAGEVGYYGQSESSSQINPLSVLEDVHPDLIITGLGEPINLGEAFGLEANRHGIGLGYVEDVWRVHARSKAVPDFVCTLDPFGKKGIEGHEPYQNHMPRIHVTGNPAIDRLVSIKPDDYVSTVCDRYELAILLAGQDESTTPVIDGLIEALTTMANEGKRVLLIPRLHPKFVSRQEFVGPWLGALAKAPCEVLWVSPKVSTDQLISSVDMTVSTYSNALVGAAHKSIAVSWVSDIGREKMRGALGGLEHFPLVDYGCAIEVSTPEEFLAITPETRDAVRARCREVLPNDGNNTARVVDAIELEFAS